ncbi:MAG: M48 family metallopeptidase, partial [Eubacteriales bacterium]|nr:M48 family metallopeptidase [Eubacteriales bacterium]
IIDYVVLHEICHLKEMNHSKNFWNLMEKYMPNYKEKRYKLKN